MTYYYFGEYIVHAPYGIQVTFTRDSGVCKSIPYIDMRDSEPEVDIVQTIRNIYEGYVNKGVKRYILYLKVQAINRHLY